LPASATSHPTPGPAIAGALRAPLGIADERLVAPGYADPPA
jgi:hypothetical protein